MDGDLGGEGMNSKTFMIIAIISVPPVDASRLNRIAAPIAEKRIANTSSRIG